MRVPPRDSVAARARARRILAGAALAVVLAAAGCSGTDAVAKNNSNGERFVSGDGDVQTPAPSDRMSAPKIRGPLLSGGSYDLSSDVGKVVVLNVWGSWCAPCRAEAPGLSTMSKQWPKKDVAFVGVDTRDEKTTAKAFLRHFDITYPNLVDSSGQLLLEMKSLPPNSTPATVVLDRQGRVAALFSKAVLPTDLNPVIRQLLAEKA